LRQPTKGVALDRRRFLAGAGAAALFGPGSVRAQPAAPSPTPTPIRIQTPDLAFADALNQARASWSVANDAADLILSIVPAEPASDSLLNDARSGARRFSGSFVPGWLISGLVRDEYIVPAAAPPKTLPASVAQLRCFGGEWYATDLDHDCDLLFFRRDVLDQYGLDPADTWETLLDQGTELTERGIGGIGLPATHAQQVVDHFASMAASYVLAPDPAASFWFDPTEMTPSIASIDHQRSLELWRRLGGTMPENLRSGSNGDLWRALADGSVVYLVASAGFLPFALDQDMDLTRLGVSPLPGVIGTDGSVQRVGNATGAGWGGVTMSSTGDRARTEVSGFLASLANSDAQEHFWKDRATGVVPAPASASEVTSMTAALAGAGWPEQLSSIWLGALHQTFTNPLQLPALRIAETRRYLQALEDRIVSFLASDETSAADTLIAAASDWAGINEAIGIDTQRDLLTRSMMPPPSVSPA
jgi:ABC-type glycerol-3-phosphate transport system substrate-binding protein